MVFLTIVFFICMSNIWTYLIVMIIIMIALICLFVHLVGQQPAHLCGRNLSVGHYVQNCSTKLVHICHAFRHH